MWDFNGIQVNAHVNVDCHRNMIGDRCSTPEESTTLYAHKAYPFAGSTSVPVNADSHGNMAPSNPLSCAFARACNVCGETAPRFGDRNETHPNSIRRANFQRIHRGSMLSLCDVYFVEIGSLIQDRTAIEIHWEKSCEHWLSHIDGTSIYGMQLASTFRTSLYTGVWVWRFQSVHMTQWQTSPKWVMDNSQ